MAVFINIPINTVTEATELPSRTYRLDLETGRIVGMIDELEAVMQAIRKALITPRFKCLIYNHNYGSEIKEAITTKDASNKYVEAVLPEYVKDCLIPDKRILEVRDFKLEFINDEAHIEFTADTIYGQLEVQEVI